MCSETLQDMIVAVDLIGMPPEGWSRLAALAGQVLTGENRHVLETAIGKGIYSAAFTKGTSLDSNANPFQDNDCESDTNLSKAYMTVRVVNKSADRRPYVDVHFSLKEPAEPGQDEPQEIRAATGHCRPKGQSK